MGFLAQEMEAILPELVRTDETGAKYINYTGIIPVTVQAIQEKQQQIDLQQQQIELQKQQLESQKQQLELLKSALESVKQDVADLVKKNKKTN